MSRLNHVANGASAIQFRKGTSDERVLTEVLEKRCYRRASVSFDVEAGEHWLDAGANIGAFALYCKARGAEPECYEPDPECFALLKRNVPEFRCISRAITADPKAKRLKWYRARAAGVYSRNSLMAARSLEAAGEVPGFYAGRFLSRKFDGVKLDIEGAEGPILDHWLLPKCNKLVLEYHTSRDASIENMARRLNLIRRHFRHVAFPPE
jgi:FkbM family methyltransferase